MSIRGFFRASRVSNSLYYKPETTQSILYDTSSSVTNTAAKLQAGVIKGEPVLRKKTGLRCGGRGESEIIPALKKCYNTRPNNFRLVSQQ